MESSGDTDVGGYNSDDFVQPEQMCQNRVTSIWYPHTGTMPMNTPSTMAAVIRRLDSGEWMTCSEKNACSSSRSVCGKSCGDNPQESDKYQYRIQDADTGEITERAEMRNPLLLWRIIDMYRYVLTAISPHAANTRASSSNSYLAV